MRVALGMCGGQQQDAEDLTQEAFITCLSRLDGLREPAAFGGFLLRTVKNLGINRWHAAHSRARAVERLTAQPVATGDDMDAFTAFAARQRATIVRAAIEALPAGPEKETAELYYLGGLDATEEVARRLKVPKSTVSTRLDRFRRSLRKALVVELARRSVRDADRHNPEEALR
jgi:RNA polymerase sigma-70 factor, ECF subfamily